MLADMDTGYNLFNGESFKELASQAGEVRLIENLLCGLSLGLSLSLSTCTYFF